MFRQNNDKDGYILYKHEETASQHNKSWCVVFSGGLIKCLRILYDYSIGSCITSLSFSQYFRSDNPEPIEMDSLSSLSHKRAILESEKPPIETVRKLDELMKERVNRHFENHLQKWKNRKRFPFKVILDLLLIVLVTAQVVIFANETNNFSRFLINNQEAFELYFKQTKCNDQKDDKLFTLQQVYTRITHIVNSYYNISEELVGSFMYVDRNENKLNTPPPLKMQIDYYNVSCSSTNESQMFPIIIDENSPLKWSTDLFPQKSDNADSPYNNNNNETCCNNTEINSISRCTLKYCDCSVEDQIKCYINRSNFERIEQIIFYFKLSTFLREDIINDKNLPVHAKFDVHIKLWNDYYSSMTIEIQVDTKMRRYCEDKNPAKTLRIVVTFVDALIILLLILSSVAHIASFIRSYGLAKDLKLHFSAFHMKRLRWTDELFILFNKWYAFMVFTNTLILVATILKIIFDHNEEISISLAEAVRILLGSGILLLWCGLFGLFSYFESLNVLFIAIRLALPSVLRFFICILILFIAFVISGWLVLGPYHPQFESFHLSLLTLFSILTGDDIFPTFEEAILSEQSLGIKIFSEIYFVLFISIFIYAVLSLFIGIFNHAYESLSENWKEYSRGYLRDWAEGERDIDNTKSYPFPVPPVRNPATSTNTDSIEEDMRSSTLSINADQSELEIPTIQIVGTSNEQQENPAIQIVGTSNEQPHNNVTHQYRIRNTSNRPTLTSPRKLQVAQPPVATRLEVNDARFRLRGSILSNEFEDDDDGKVH